MLRLALVALLAISACDGGSGGGMPDGGGPPDDGRTPDGMMPDGGPSRACMVIATNPACVAAETMPTIKLDWIEQNIFTPNCGGGSCHGTPPGGGPPGGRITLITGSHSKLVNVDSMLAVGRKLVVPNDVPKSYLMVMLRAISLTEADPAPAPAPSGNRYMPLGSPPICCQKLDAIGRWIAAGALNN